MGSLRLISGVFFTLVCFSILLNMLNIRAIVCMGVSGCGKSSVAEGVAGALGYEYHDADNYHPEANKLRIALSPTSRLPSACPSPSLIPSAAKMKSGIPLNDEDRAPWLATLAELLAGAFKAAGPSRLAHNLLSENSRGVVLACSALKRRYRDVLRGGRDHTTVLFVHLRGSKELILNRMIERQRIEGHYMPPSLLDSQFAALEVPTADEHVLSIDIDTPLEQIVKVVVGHVQ